MGKHSRTLGRRILVENKQVVEVIIGMLTKGILSNERRSAEGCIASCIVLHLDSLLAGAHVAKFERNLASLDVQADTSIDGGQRLGQQATIGVHLATAALDAIDQLQHRRDVADDIFVVVETCAQLAIRRLQLSLRFAENLHFVLAILQLLLLVLLLVLFLDSILTSGNGILAHAFVRLGPLCPLGWVRELVNRVDGIGGTGHAILIVSICIIHQPGHRKRVSYLGLVSTPHLGAITVVDIGALCRGVIVDVAKEIFVKQIIVIIATIVEDIQNVIGDMDRRRCVGDAFEIVGVDNLHR